MLRQPRAATARATVARAPPQARVVGWQTATSNPEVPPRSSQAEVPPRSSFSRSSTKCAEVVHRRARRPARISSSNARAVVQVPTASLDQHIHCLLLLHRPLRSVITSKQFLDTNSRWLEALDNSTGKLYFVDLPTQQSSWEAPASFMCAARAGLSTSSPVSLSRQTNQPALCPRPFRPLLHLFSPHPPPPTVPATRERHRDRKELALALQKAHADLQVRPRRAAPPSRQRCAHPAVCGTPRRRRVRTLSSPRYGSASRRRLARSRRRRRRLTRCLGVRLRRRAS